MKNKLALLIILPITLFASVKAIGLNHHLKSGKIIKHISDTTSSKKLKLVWSDEFNYTGLPDSAKWNFEEGMVRNHEKQFYTKGRKANAVVKDGALVITAIKEQFVNKAYRAGNTAWQRKDSAADYTSASINTKGKADWKYGKIVVRAKLPAGKGVWPAIWMLGSNISKVGWPICGEIDIMENVGFEPDRVYATMHYLDPAAKKPVQNMKHTLSQTLSSEFHIYTLEWDEKFIKIYLDDTLYQAFNIDDAGTGINGYRQNQYLLLNLALGGDWGGKIDDSIFPQQFIIDYVRVYQ
jgi:beta-glucanase (GH16 family)